VYSAWRWFTKPKHVTHEKWLIELCLDLLSIVLLLLLLYLHLSPSSFLLSSVPVVSPSPPFHSHSSTVSTAIALHAALSSFWKPVRSTDFSLLPKYPDQLWGPPTFLFNRFQGSFLWLSGWHTQVNRSPLSSFEVKNEWSCTSTPPICLHGVDGDNF